MTNEDRQIAVVEIDGTYIKITASHHAMGRMAKREVDKYVVAGNVLALGPDRISELQKNNDEAIIIDEANNVSVVIGFDKKSITSIP